MCTSPLFNAQYCRKGQNLLLAFTNLYKLWLFIGKGKEFAQTLNHLVYSQFKENPSQRALEVTE